jgi:hypothetical protein
MRKILTTLAAASAAALIASSAGAACFDKHQQVMASTPQEETTTVMSTHDGTLPTLEDEKADEAKAAETSCAEGDKDCEPATE